MAKKEVKLKKFTVLSNTKNVKKIDETLDGPFIGFYNIRTEEALYYSVNEFVEAVRAKFWMHNEPLRSE